MARRRASMREGPLAELFKATEAAQRQAEREQVGEGEAASGSQLPIEEAPTVESAAPSEAPVDRAGDERPPAAETPSPGWIFVPRWRTMIEPAVTSWPP